MRVQKHPNENVSRVVAACGAREIEVCSMADWISPTIDSHLR